MRQSILSDGTESVSGEEELGNLDVSRVSRVASLYYTIRQICFAMLSDMRTAAASPFPTTRGNSP